MDATRALEAMHRSRRVPSTPRVHPVGDAIGLDLDVSVEIGPENCGARTRRQDGEGFRRGMPVLVAGPVGDERDGRLRRVEQSRRGRRRGSMMTDLEHVDLRDRAAREQLGLDGRLGVAGQQRRKASVCEQQDDRAVVDVPVRQWRGRLGRAGVEHRDIGRRVERDVLSGAGDDDRRRRSVRIGQQALEGGILVADARLEDGADAEAVEHVDQSGDVILVRMGQHQQVDASREERQVRADASKGELRIRAAVDQHGGTGGRLDQDGVALSDVERREVQPPVGLRAEGDRQEHADQSDGDRQRPYQPSQPWMGTCRLRLEPAVERLESRTARRPTGDAEEREPRERKGRRDAGVDGRVRHRGHGRPQRDDDPQHEPCGSAGEPRQRC